MIIKEIELYNFRIYKGANKINLVVDQNKNIIIVSGRNGFGKTTFLMSMIWCLYGRQMQDVDDIYRKEIDEQGGYNKYISNSLNRLAKSEGESKFYVSTTFTNLGIKEVPCNEITIQRSFNTIDSVDEVSVFIDGHPSELAKEVGPEIFIREFIMPIEIAKFFFFDAEKIVNLSEINSVEQKKKLSKAYSEVLGIKKYEDLKKDLESLQIKLKQDSAIGNEKKELESLTLSLNEYQNQIEYNEAKKIEFLDKKTIKSKLIREIQDKLIKAGSRITLEELTGYRIQEEVLSSKFVDLQNQLRDYYDIIPFAIAGNNFSDLIKQVEQEDKWKTIHKQEQIANIAISDILSALENIDKPQNLSITNQIHGFYIETFKELIEEHYSSKLMNIPKNFRVIHELSESEKNELLALWNNLQISFKNTFKRLTIEYNQTKNELGFIKRNIREAEDYEKSPILMEYTQQRLELQEELLRLEALIDELHQENEKLNQQMLQLNNKIESLAKKIAVSEKNKEKYESVASQISVLESFIHEFKNIKRLSLENRILEGLEILLHKSGFVDAVEVMIEGDMIDIMLKNSRGEEIKKETLSKGEQQMYATALLRGLVEESDIQFPIFIDSPMQKFDELHAENIVRHFYPTISSQVVIFPLINKELTDKEYHILLPRIKKTFIIHNVHEDKSEFLAINPASFLQEYHTMYHYVN